MSTETPDIVNKLIYHCIFVIHTFIRTLIRHGSGVAVMRYKTKDGYNVMTIITKDSDGEK